MEGGGGVSGAGPLRRPHHQAVDVLMRTMELSYENEVGLIDWVGKVLFLLIDLKAVKQY